MRMNKKKKGLIDILFFVVALFILSLVIITSWTILNKTHDEINGTVDAEYLPMITRARDSYVNSTEFIFMAAMFGLTIFVAVSAYYIRSSAALIMVGILALIIFTYFALIFSGVWSQIAEGEVFADYSSAYTVIPFVMENFHFFVLGLMALALILMYGKRPQL